MLFKREKWLIFVLCLLMVCPYAMAEGILAFEEAEYSIIPGKTITLTPIAQGIGEKLTYSWESSHPEIAKVSQNGKVTGVSAGSVLITCTGSAKTGEKYTAKCTVNVNRPIEKITANAKQITLPAYYKFSMLELFSIEPTDLDVYPLQFTLEGNDILQQVGNEGHEFLTTGTGKIKMTLKAGDGSGKKATISITVPTFFVSDDSITVTEKEGYLMWYTGTGSFSIGVDYSEDLFELEKLKKEEATNYDGFPDGLMTSGADFCLIVPKAAGKGSITINVNGKKIKIPVKIEEEALPYPPKKAKDLTKEDVGQPMSLTGVVKRKNGEKENRGERDYYIVYVKQGEDYFSIRSLGNPACSEGNEFKFYGTLVEMREYRTETGLTYPCPEILMDKVERVKTK